MKNYLKWTLIIALCGCASVRLTEPQPADLERMQQKVPDISYDEAVQGFNLYKSKCNRCHGLHRPNEFTKQRWEKILPEMFAKAKLIDEVERQTLSKYLFANSQ